MTQRPPSVARPADPTKLSSVTTQRFWLAGELAKVLPTATRDEIIRLQEYLQAQPVAAVQASLAHMWAAPEQTLAPMRQGTATPRRA